MLFFVPYFGMLKEPLSCLETMTDPAGGYAAGGRVGSIQFNSNNVNMVFIRNEQYIVRRFALHFGKADWETCFTNAVVLTKVAHI